MSITLDSLRERVPAIFTKTPSPKVSDRYSFADSEYYLQKFIDADWKIHHISQLEPFDETPVYSEIAVIAALEMPRGWFAANSLAAGAQLTLLNSPSVQDQ
jgi:hypothetical protein